MTDDKTAARALLDRAVSTEPALNLDPQALLRTAQKRLGRRRAMVTAGVVAGVAVIAAGTMTLPRPHQVDTAATPLPSTGPPSLGVPIATALKSHQDEQSRRLTQAFKDANVLPPDTVIDDPSGTGQLEFATLPIPGWYQAQPVLRTGRGAGHLSIRVSPGPAPSYFKSCKDLVNVHDCTERTLPDGSSAVMFTTRDCFTKSLEVVRPNGSFNDIVLAPLGGMSINPPGTCSPPPAEKLPLSDDTLWRIGEIAGLTE
jgi:hypothetical protein